VRGARTEQQAAQDERAQVHRGERARRAAAGRTLKR